MTRRLPAVKMTVAALSVLAALSVAPSADAHRSGCHRWHSCPSDHHTYRWSAKKLLCTSYSAERRRADTAVVNVAGRRYWCGK